MKSLDKKRFYDTAFPVARKMVERMFEDLVFNGSYKKPVEVDSKYFPEDFVDMVARKFGTLDRATGKYKINDMSVQKASRAFAQHMLFKMMGKSNDAKFFADTGDLLMLKFLSFKTAKSSTWIRTHYGRTP